MCVLDSKDKASTWCSLGHKWVCVKLKLGRTVAQCVIRGWGPSEDSENRGGRAECVSVCLSCHSCPIYTGVMSSGDGGSNITCTGRWFQICPRCRRLCFTFLAEKYRRNHFLFLALWLDFSSFRSREKNYKRLALTFSILQLQLNTLESHANFAGLVLRQELECYPSLNALFFVYLNMVCAWPTMKMPRSSVEQRWRAKCWRLKHPSGWVLQSKFTLRNLTKLNDVQVCPTCNKRCRLCVN